MADHTHIEWTDATWNPVTGCSVTSPGCTNCYAMKLAGTRLAHHPSRAGLTRETKAGPVWTGEVRLNEEWLTQPLRWKRPRKVFVCAHGDLFHENVPDEWIDRVFAVMALAPQHTFQCLTKRSARMREYLSCSARPFRVAKAMTEISGAPTEPEEILPIAGFPGYFVSSHGHVYSERRGARKRLRPIAGEQGHLRVPLFRDGGPKRGCRLLVHRVVLEAFDQPAPSLDAQGRHLDGNPGNNAISNLTWGGQPENWEDSKRHGNFRRYSKLTDADVAAIRSRAEKGDAAYAIAKDFPVSDTQVRNILTGKQWAVVSPIQWPLPGVWLGVSVEDQARADERIPDLLATPAAVRWISAEPLLGPVDLRWIAEPDDEKDGVIDALLGCNWIDSQCGEEFRPARPGHQDRIMRRWVCSPEADILANRKLDWVVVGGESGPGARPMHPDWARGLRDQCAAAGVPFLFKQWGEWAPHVPRPGGDLGADVRAGSVCVVHPSGRDEVEIFEATGGRNTEPGTRYVAKVGKKRAGRLLDGALHDGYPEART